MRQTRLRSIWWAGIASLALAGCGVQVPVEVAADAANPQNPTTASLPSAPAATQDAPSFTSSMPPATATAGTPYQFQVSANDADSISLTYSAQGLPGWLTLNPQSGLLSGTPANDDAGETADIIVRVTDGQTSVALPAFRIRIAAVAAAPTPPPAPDNQAPTISGTPTTRLAATTAYAFTPTATDVDSMILTYAVANKPSWASFSTTTGRLSGTPGRTDTGSYGNIVISVSDGQLSASLPAFTVTVTSAPNTAPTITGSPASSVTAGSAYNFMPSASDVDGQALSFSIVNRPSWANFSSATGQLSGTPTAAQVGSYGDIVISVSDGTATTALPAFTLAVSAQPNAAPTITGSPLTSVQAGSAYSFTPTASDPDGQMLGFSISNKPSWASFSTANGQLSGTPGSGAAGQLQRDRDHSQRRYRDRIAAGVHDHRERARRQWRADDCRLSGDRVQAGSAYNFTPTASDPEGNPLTFSISGRPAWAAFNAGNGALTGTPTAAQVGSYGSIVISVSDGTTTRSLPAFSINVTSVGASTGTATLRWSAPTSNTDGSALTDLAGYRIYHGTSASALNDVTPISNPGISTYVFDTLASGTHYFAISAVNAAGAESARSSVGSKTIP